MSTVTETEATTTRKGPPTKTELPVPEGGYTSWPEEFDSAVHKMPKRSDFGDETIWLDYQAERYEAKAQAYRDESKLLRSIGSVEQRKQAARLQTLQASMAKLAEQLKAQGVDVAALLNS